MSSAKRGGIFTGFGFGAIQAGLFTLEALRENAFEQVVVCEISGTLVERVRANNGLFSVNIAHPDGIETMKLGPIDILNPESATDRELIVDKLRRSREAATAVPSVDVYTAGGPASIHQLLAEASLAERNAPLVVYTAENDNRAAELLAGAVRGAAELPEDDFNRKISFVNTVIAKMSGVITAPEEIASRGLETLAPGHDSAILVEEFNRILVSTPRVPPGGSWQPSFSTFETREDLLPFEEAKLHGHNGVHAMGAYLAELLGRTRMDELESVPGAVDCLHGALVDESGAALLKKYGGIDELFTPAGFARHAEELIPRMLNPHLGDLVARVARDPGRKLGWNDRLAGTLRLGLETGIDMPRFALAAAAALAYLDPSLKNSADTPRPILESLWKKDTPAATEAAAVCSLIEAGLERLRTIPPDHLFT